MKHNPILTNWLTTLTTATQQNQLVKAALTQPTPQAEDLKSVDIRPIMVKRQLKLSFTYHHKTKDIVKNYTPEESTDILAKLMDKSFTQAKIFSLEADTTLKKQGKIYTVTPAAPTQNQVPSLSHDKPKQRLIEGTSPWMHALNLTDSKGEVYKNAQDKFRQINKYIEILDGLLKPLPASQKLNVVDMGSGKGYLTFALYEHLTTNLKRQANVTGIEYRPDMIKLCNEVAQSSGFTGLIFQRGTIADSDCTDTNVVIALHACDTATDEALAKGIQAGAHVIVVAPCCHKQIRKQLNQSLTTKALQTNPLYAALRFGTYAERVSEMLTDTLRTLLLERSGYTTNLFEFIGGEHTPKNVMIVATRNTKPLTPAQHAKIQSDINSLKATFGLTHHFLETSPAHLPEVKP